MSCKGKFFINFAHYSCYQYINLPIYGLHNCIVMSYSNVDVHVNAIHTIGLHDYVRSIFVIGTLKHLKLQ